MKFVLLLFIVLSLGVLSCKSAYLYTPPVLEKENISAFTYELKYISNTDQIDRKKGFIHIVFNTKRGKLIHERDSIRTQRVYEIYLDDTPKTDDDKFMMGLLFMHSWDQKHYQIAYELFADLEENGTTKSARLNGANWKNIVVKHRSYTP
jgi:hypothetical protein